MGWEES
jgi:hypothetical protein